MENYQKDEITTIGIRAVDHRTVIGGDGPILKLDGTIDMVATFDLLLNIVADIKSDVIRMQKRSATPLNSVAVQIEQKLDKKVSQTEGPQVIDEIPEPIEKVVCDADLKEAATHFGDVTAVTKTQRAKENTKVDERQLLDEMPKPELGVIIAAKSIRTIRKYKGGDGVAINSETQPRFV